MAEQTQQKPNAFDGLTLGQAVLKLKASPPEAGLDSEFDAKFKDNEEVDTLERARLHATNSFYTGTAAGAGWLRNASMFYKQIKEGQKPDYQPPKEAQGLAENVRKMLYPTPEEVAQQFESVVGDLAKYEMMRPVSENLTETTLQTMGTIGRLLSNPIGTVAGVVGNTGPAMDAAILGGIAGGLPSPENLLRIPGLGGKFATATGRTASAALEGFGANAAIDAGVQQLLIDAEHQKNFDPWRAVLTGALGSVIGGGLVGASEVISKRVLQKGIAALAETDPAMRSQRIDAALRDLEYEVIEAKFNPDAKVDDKPIFAAVKPEEVKTGEVKTGDEVARQSSTLPLRGEPLPNPNYARPPEIVKSLQTMTQELEDTIGVPIRQGRVGVKDALGTYNTRYGVVHMQEYPDFSVATHEVAHHLDFTDQEIRNLTNQYGAELARLDYDPAAARVFEGFAEFMRMFLTGPAYAQNNAPGFYSAFTNHLERTNLPLLEKMVGFQKAYRNYLDAMPEQIIAAGIVTPRQTIGDKIVALLTDAKVAPTVRNVASLLYDAFINKNQDITRVNRAIAAAIKKRTGQLVDLLPSENPMYHFEMLQRSNQTAYNHIANGVYDYGTNTPVGPSILQALTTAIGKDSITGKWDSVMFDKFSAYLKARLGTVRWDMFNAGMSPNAPFVEAKAYFDALIRQYDQDYPQFRAASEMLNEYNRNQRHRARDAGVHGYTAEAVAEMDKQPFYVPARRDRSDIIRGQGSSDGGTGAPMRFQGSMRDVINPIIAMIDNTVGLERKIAHDAFMRAQVAFSMRAGRQGGKFVEPLSPTQIKAIGVDLDQVIRQSLRDENYSAGQAKQISQDFLNDFFGDTAVEGTAFKTVRRDGKEEPIVFYGENGELKAARLITKEEGFGLYELVTTAPKPVQDIAIRLLGAVSSTLTVAVTAHPAYALKNFFRDQFPAWAFIKGYNPLIDPFRGLKHALTNDEFAKAYKEFGGVNPGMQFAPSMETVKADVDALAREGFSVRKLFSLHAWAEAVSLAEKATRLGATDRVFREMKKHGMSDYDAMLEAVRQATDLLDWGRYGSRTAAIRHVTPFMTSYIASMDKARRAGITPLVRKWIAGEEVFVKDTQEFNQALTAWTKLGIVGFGTGMAWAALNWEKESYKNAGVNAMAGNFILPVGDDSVLMLPKPWELSIGFTAGEYMYRGLFEKDPRAAQQFAESVWDATKPSVPIWSNPAIKTISETIMNYNTFTGRPIVSERWAGVEAEYQARGRTSSAAKAISRATGMSPLKIDFLIKGGLGYFGQDIAMMGKGDEHEGIVDRLADWTLLRAGIKDPALISDAREKFWKHMGRTTGDYAQAVNTYNLLSRSPKDIQNAADYFQKLPNNRKAWVVLNSAGDTEGKQVFNADNRRSHALQRAADAVSVINDVQNDLSESSLENKETREPIQMTPDQKKRFSRLLNQWGLAEMLNGLIITKEPGYQNQKLYDMETFYERAKAISPKAAEEIAARYATKKVYKTEGVAKVYDDLQSSLVRDGSQADVALLTDEVKSYGYEFGADRRKRTGVKRAPIGGTK